MRVRLPTLLLAAQAWAVARGQPSLCRKQRLLAVASAVVAAALLARGLVVQGCAGVVGGAPVGAAAVVVVGSQLLVCLPTLLVEPLGAGAVAGAGDLASLWWWQLLLLPVLTA